MWNQGFCTSKTSLLQNIINVLENMKVFIFMIFRSSIINIYFKLLCSCFQFPNFEVGRFLADSSQQTSFFRIAGFVVAIVNLFNTTIRITIKLNIVILNFKSAILQRKSKFEQPYIFFLLIFDSGRFNLSKVFRPILNYLMLRS